MIFEKLRVCGIFENLSRKLIIFFKSYNNGGALYEDLYTRSVRKVSDLFLLFEHLMDYNLTRLHEPTLNLSAHA